MYVQFKKKYDEFSKKYPFKVCGVQKCNLGLVFCPQCFVTVNNRSSTAGFRSI